MSEAKCVGRKWPKDCMTSVQCNKTARYEHNGKPYCGTHYPPNVEAKRAERDKRWDEEREARNKATAAYLTESKVKDFCADWVAENYPAVYAELRRKAEEQPR